VTAAFLAAADLAGRHPSIDLDANVLYADNGRLLTSAGAAAGFDLCFTCPAAMTALLAWMEQNLSRELPLPVIARRAAMSTRTLSRFREQMGATPAAWLAHARVRRAQRLLETADLAIEQVAAEAGFGCERRATGA